MSAAARKENIKLTYLKAVGIILVVLGHSGGGISFASDWFPYYSFHMPLFIFASGYFYKNKSDFFGYIKKRFLRLVLPYYFWNLVYGTIVTIFLSLGFIAYGNRISIENFFVEPWLKAHQYIFNGPAWFVLCLFLIQVIYFVTKALFNKINIKNEYLLTAIYFAFGMLGTFLATDDTYRQSYLTWIRVLFGLPFIQLGYLYHAKLEKWDKPSIGSFALLFTIQALLLVYFDGKLDYVVWSGDFNGRVLAPFMTSITGIWFWLQISDILARKIGHNAVVSYIGNNTLAILIHQYFAFWMLNTFYYLIKAPGFDAISYQNGFFYKYIFRGDQHSLIFYAIAGLAIPLILKYIFERSVEILMKKNPEFA